MSLDIAQMLKFYMTGKQDSTTLRLIVWNDRADNWWIDFKAPYPFDDDFWHSDMYDGRKFARKIAKKNDAPEWVMEGLKEYHD